MPKTQKFGVKIPVKKATPVAPPWAKRKVDIKGISRRGNQPKKSKHQAAAARRMEKDF